MWGKRQSFWKSGHLKYVWITAPKKKKSLFQSINLSDNPCLQRVVEDKEGHPLPPRSCNFMIWVKCFDITHSWDPLHFQELILFLQMENATGVKSLGGD